MFVLCCTAGTGIACICCLSLVLAYRMLMFAGVHIPKKGLEQGQYACAGCDMEDLLPPNAVADAPSIPRSAHVARTKLLQLLGNLRIETRCKKRVLGTAARARMVARGCHSEWSRRNTGCAGARGT